MPLDLVIFDCDGVLIDSDRVALKVDSVMLRELGWPMTEAETIERFVGRSEQDAEAIIEEHLARKLPAGWREPYAPLYRHVFETELVAVDGIIEALDRIDLPTCIASSGTHEYLRFVLGLTGLYERFAGRIFSRDDVANGKPAPDLFLHAAAQMRARPVRCVVVEDSRHGLQAARAAGMPALAYVNGLTPVEALEGPNTIVFDDMRELPTLLAALDPSTRVSRR